MLGAGEGPQNGFAEIEEEKFLFCLYFAKMLAKEAQLPFQGGFTSNLAHSPANVLLEVLVDHFQNKLPSEF